MRSAQIRNFYEFECVVDSKAIVAECPRWHPLENCLYWVDIYKPTLNRLDPASGEQRSWKMPERIGCFSFRRDGGIIAGMQSGIYLVDFENEVKTRCLFEYERDNPQYRMNDGRCDPAGRFWVGSIHESLDRRVGSLFRLDPDGRCTKMVDRLIASNGLAFSADGTTMYHSDSRQDYVWKWDVDPATGDISNQRVFLAIDIQEGRPDGAAIDSEGCYWICHVGAWRVARYRPNGSIDRVVGLPVQRPTMCAFGGKDLKTLYVTTATFPLATTDLQKQSLAGGIFALSVDVPGIPEPFFGGP